MKTAFLFAGQGSQFVGMGRDFYEEYQRFREVFDLLPEKQKQIAFEGPEDELGNTANTQPILLAFALGVYGVINDTGLKCDVAAGLSLGEYSALAASGVFSPRQALELIQFRADAMAKASEGTNTVMSAVLGLDRDKVIKAAVAGGCEIANYNCPGQIVISGTECDVKAAEAEAGALGAKRCVRLAVSGPFHTSYMKPAGEALKQRFERESFAEEAFPVVFNCKGSVRNGERISELLVKQVSGSVMFEDTIRYMSSVGVTRAVEIGPGRALSQFVKKTCGDIETVSIERTADLGRISTWAEERQ